MNNIEELFLTDAREIILKHRQQSFIQVMKNAYQSDITEEKLLLFINLWISSGIKEVLDFFNAQVKIQNVFDREVSIHNELSALIRETQLDEMSSSDEQ